MKTVLIVDDEFDLADTLRAILEGEGYRIETCSNGKEALERLKTAKLDLVLMDVMMPILSGFEVLQAMRKAPELDPVPVVLMSSVSPGVKQEDYRWQAFLRKPFSLQMLLATVERLIGKGRASGVASARPWPITPKPLPMLDAWQTAFAVATDRTA